MKRHIQTDRKTSNTIIESLVIVRSLFIQFQLTIEPRTYTYYTIQIALNRHFTQEDIIINTR